MKLGMRELLFFTILLGVLVASYFILTKKAADRKRKEAETEVMSKSLADLEQSTAGIDDLNRKIAELQQAITFFESKLPQAKDMDKVLREVSQMADANSLQTKTVRTLKTEKNPNYSEQPIEMNLVGDFNGFYSFLLQLEKLPRLTRVPSMALQKADKDGEMQAKFTLSIFFEPDRPVASAE